MLHAEAARPSDALLDARWIPRKIEVHDYRRASQIDPLAQQIGREQEVDPLDQPPIWRIERELIQHFLPADRPGCDVRGLSMNHRNAGIVAKHFAESQYRARVLTERHDPGMRMRDPNRP